MHINKKMMIPIIVLSIIVIIIIIVLGIRFSDSHNGSENNTASMQGERTWVKARREVPHYVNHRYFTNNILYNQDLNQITISAKPAIAKQIYPVQNHSKQATPQEAKLYNKIDKNVKKSSKKLDHKSGDENLSIIIRKQK